MNRQRLLVLTVLILGIAAVRQVGGDEPKKAAEPPKRLATAAEALQTLPGFKVELLHSSDSATEGSWISMTKDGKGRLLISGQHNQPILRVTLKDGKVDKIEKIEVPISEAMGMLWAFDSLYIDGAGPKGYGIYRCKDTKGADQFDDVQFLGKTFGGGEHGAHGLVLGPDNHIYVILGNFVDLPPGLSPNSPHQHFQEDQLLNRQWDGNGFAIGRYAPGGYVLRTDADGKDWELVLGGFRNAYDIAFNADGELFTFDSDMEWDWGMPWYRPIRINHCTSGAEFGWRAGSGKWPENYADSLPATVNVGIGSPTGTVFGTGAKFPAKYQKALYALDWTYGRLIAVHLTPKGSSYTATWENFVAPKSLKGEGPKAQLNLTDVVIGDDGAMYFTIGGRNTQSGLYRVTYTGEEPTAKADLHDKTGEAERKLRHEIEAFHGKADPKAVETAWPSLNSDDRFLRYAARIAIEFQPLTEWKPKALAEKGTNGALTALLALARTDKPEGQKELLTALERFPLDKLTDEQKFEKLRVLSLSFIRQGRPAPDFAKRLVAELESQFPGTNELLNRELAQVIIFLQPPNTAEKILKQAASVKTQQDQLHYLFHLRTLPIGMWTLDQRKEYFSYFTKEHKKLPYSPEYVQWFNDAGRGPGDGSSFNNFMKHIFQEAVANLSDSERTQLADLLKSIDKADLPTYDVKPRPVVKAYKMEDIVPLLDKIDKGRDFNKGKEAYLVGQCIKCHRFGNEGGAVGPDLTAISSRFGRRDILESIIEPSKVISEQYQDIQLITTAAKSIKGRLVRETKDVLVIQPNPLSPEVEEVKRADLDGPPIPSKVSPMPEHLVDGLTADEILDLLAYLESGGVKTYRAFRK